jgi:hypothetical protein
MMTRVDFQVQPPGYKHWRLTCAGPVATGIELTPLDKTRTDDGISYRHVTELAVC